MAKAPKIHANIYLSEEEIPNVIRALESVDSSGANDLINTLQMLITSQASAINIRLDTE